MTPEEQVAADATAKAEADAAAKAEEAAKAEAASAAAAELAKRKAEKAAAEEAAVKMVDLHDLRAELRGEVAKLRAVPHAVPTPPPAPAQRRGGSVWSGIIGGVLVVLILFGLAVFSERSK